MQSDDRETVGLSNYVSCEARVPKDHPLRLLRAIADEALEVLSPQLERFDADARRPSIAPGKLLRSLLLQALYTIPSEQELIEQLDYNLLFRWFVGLTMDAPPWDVAEFAAGRQRLSSGAAASRFLAKVLSQPRVKLLLSDDHFSPDGRLIEAWARPASSQSRRWCTPSGARRSAECDSYGENGERLPYHPARPTAG